LWINPLPSSHLILFSWLFFFFHYLFQQWFFFFYSFCSILEIEEDLLLSNMFYSFSPFSFKQIWKFEGRS
jgi:hypothetical protein